ncbi:MAG: hypothetical protein KDA78_21410, partial [Planctomycetaceae bacterium]|nr:hypothetical protein [Planctomycetaceae bacterium]
HLDLAPRDPRMQQVATFLITGPHAAESPLFAEQWSEFSNLYEQEPQRLKTSASLIVQRNKTRGEQSSEQEFLVYRLKSNATTDGNRTDSEAGGSP